MSTLDAGEVQQHLSPSILARLDEFEAFESIGSTNTYLLEQTAPEPDRFRVAVADEQTDGRGRHSRRWVSPMGAGLYLSLAYTFEKTPPVLPALTLALGVGVISALDRFGEGNFRLKWPNDVIAGNGKLGGILTEARPYAGGGVLVVTGVGLNIDLDWDPDPPQDAAWALPATDLVRAVGSVPPREKLAASLVEALVDSTVRFQVSGFEVFASAWRERDWLRGRHIIVELAGGEISGIADGVGDDGALYLDGPGGRTRIASGSIAKVSEPGTRA